MTILELLRDRIEETAEHFFEHQLEMLDELEEQEEE